MKNIGFPLSFLLIVLTGMFFSGCKDDMIDTGGVGEERNVHLSFALNEPGDITNETTKNRSLTRAADQELTANDLTFLLFKNDGTSTSFVYKPSNVSLIKTGTYTYEANFKIPDINYGTIDMVVLAHYQGNIPSDGQTVESFETSNLIANLQGKYDASKPIPLWGECSFETQTAHINTSVVLLRSLAKIGLYIENKDDAAFKMESIQSIRVYRTLNKMALFTADENYIANNYTVTQPTIPEDAVFNLANGSSSNDIDVANQNPLVYDLSDTSPNSFLNGIFVPEKMQGDDTDLSTAMAVVVGTTLEGVPGVRYYRVDIAEYEGFKPKTFYPILRNHSYRIRLEGAIDDGEETPEEALKAIPKTWVYVQKWNSIDLDADLNGQYFLELETKELRLPWTKDSELEIGFSTNIPDDHLTNDFQFRWGEDGNETTNNRFEMTVDVAAKKIKIKTKIDNPTSNAVSDTLNIFLLNHSFRYQVVQLHKNADYFISQQHYNVQGVYVRNMPLNESNTITVRLVAESNSTDISNLRYHLTAIENGGLYIDQEGLFDSELERDENGRQYQDVVLAVKGMVNSPTDKTLTVITDGTNISFVNITVPVAFIPKTILGLFGDTGNRLSMNNDFSTLYQSSANFGIEETSTVKSETITYVEETGNDIAGYIATHKPDVIIIGNGYPLDATQIATLKSFMTNVQNVNTGAVIMMTTDESVLDLMQDLEAALPGSPVFRLVNTPPNGIGSYTFMRPNTNSGTAEITPILSDEDYYYRYKLPVFDWDKISNGAFGLIGSWYIAMEENADKSIIGLDNAKILKYSGNQPYGVKTESQRRDNGVTSLRLADYNLYWVGADNFLRNNQWQFGAGGEIENHSLANNSYSPSSTANRNIEFNTLKLTNNGFVFANILYWALYSSEYGSR